MTAFDAAENDSGSGGEKGRYFNGAGIERFALPAVLLTLLLLVVYGNSFHGPFLFDDLVNIVDNPNIHSRNLSLEELAPAVHGIDFRRAAGVRRPVSYLSFAVNHSLGGLDPFGYHLVNFAVHVLSTLLLFFFTYRVLRLTPFGKNRSSKSLLSIALLSAALWASHPIQVTAVTYIVQRMAALAGLFTLICMYCYVEARTAEGRTGRWLYIAGCAAAGALAVGSKENAAMLPVNLALLEVFVLGGFGRKHRHFNRILFGLAAFLVLFAGLWYTDFAGILAGYQIRPFTLAERLMTEPRIFFFYVWQLLYPVSGQFTIFHDVALSTGLFSPWTTLPAIVAFLALPLAALLLKSRLPIVSFSILFFWVNHLIESTVVPLELIFEHRNYLPSMFFFLGPSMGFVYLLEKYSPWRPPVLSCFALLAVFVWAQGHTVHMRNALFRHPLMLWQDNAEKYPNLHRPNHNLANEYFAAGKPTEALGAAHRALQAKAPARKRQKYITWYNLGLFFLYEGSLERALSCLERAQEIEPRDGKIYHKMAVVHRIEGRLDLAERYVLEALRRSGGASVFLPTYAMVLLQKGEVAPVVAMAAEQLKKPEASPQWYYLLGEAFRKKGDLSRAELYFSVYGRAFPRQMAVNASLVEIYSLTGRREDQDRLARRLFCQAKDIGLAEILYQYDRRYNTLDDGRIQRIERAVCASIERQCLPDTSAESGGS